MLSASPEDSSAVLLYTTVLHSAGHFKPSSDFSGTNGSSKYSLWEQVNTAHSLQLTKVK